MVAYKWNAGIPLGAIVLMGDSVYARIFALPSTVDTWAAVLALRYVRLHEEHWLCDASSTGHQIGYQTSIFHSSKMLVELHVQHLRCGELASASRTMSAYSGRKQDPR